MHTCLHLGVPRPDGLMKSDRVTVNGSHISQTIEWEKVGSVDQNITHFIAVYGESSEVKTYNSTDAQNVTVTSNETTAILTLPIPRGNITYNVWLAAVGEKTGAGEYSDVLKIDYTSKTREYVFF